VRIATWNVNALTPERLDRIFDWVDSVHPDVLCMQETKVTDDVFPALDFHARGYASVHHGEGRWNGVAIVSRVGLADPVSGFADGGDPDADARLVSAICGGVRFSSVYVPNGRAVGHEQFAYKLAWLARLRAHVDAESRAAGGGRPVAVCGDFNVAPADIDVWNPAAFEGDTHVTPEERAALAELEDWGLRDAFRERYPGVPRLFSWWDYRAGNFHKNFGMRIDHLLVSAPLRERVVAAEIDREARKGKPVPSDHAPLVIDLDQPGHAFDAGWTGADARTAARRGR
jgi:exodeoxyribonuclease III